MRARVCEGAMKISARNWPIFEEMWYLDVWASSPVHEAKIEKEFPILNITKSHVAFFFFTSNAALSNHNLILSLYIYVAILFSLYTLLTSTFCCILQWSQFKWLGRWNSFLIEPSLFDER